MERQNLLDGLADAIVQAERDAGLRLLLAPLELESQLEKKEFLEDQPDVGRRARSLQVLKALAGIGPVHLPQRVPRRDQAHVAAYDAGNGSGAPAEDSPDVAWMMRRNQRGVRRPWPADS